MGNKLKVELLLPVTEVKQHRYFIKVTFLPLAVRDMAAKLLLVFLSPPKQTVGTLSGAVTKTLGKASKLKFV
jgi:hypothetical protein